MDVAIICIFLSGIMYFIVVYMSLSHLNLISAFSICSFLLFQGVIGIYFIKARSKVLEKLLKGNRASRKDSKTQEKVKYLQLSGGTMLFYCLFFLITSAFVVLYSLYWIPIFLVSLAFFNATELFQVLSISKKNT